MVGGSNPSAATIQATRQFAANDGQTVAKHYLKVVLVRISNLLRSRLPCIDMRSQLALKCGILDTAANVERVMALSNDKLMKELADEAGGNMVLLYKAIEDTPSRKVGWFSIPAKQPDDIKKKIKDL